MGCAASMAASAGGPTSQPVLGGKDKSNPPGDTPRLEGGAAQSSDSQWGPAQAEAKAGSITESVWDLTEINRLSRGAWCGDDCDGTINNPIVACQAPTAPFDDKGALPQQLTGLALLSDPSCNRGGGFTGAERTLLGIRGLLPPAVQTLKRQEDLLMSLVRSAKTGIEKHRIMQAVKVRQRCHTDDLCLSCSIMTLLPQRRPKITPPFTVLSPRTRLSSFQSFGRRQLARRVSSTAGPSSRRCRKGCTSRSVTREVCLPWWQTGLMTPSRSSSSQMVGAL